MVCKACAKPFALFIDPSRGSAPYDGPAKHKATCSHCLQIRSYKASAWRSFETQQVAEGRLQPHASRHQLPSGTRGLVVSAPIEISSGRLLVKSSDLDPQELRFSLLFWDLLDCPDNNVVSLHPGQDAEFLASAGILQRTRVQIGISGAMEELFRTAHIGAFRMLDAAEPGVWSVATGDRSISFLDSELKTGRGALVQLHRAIPVPDKDVHLQDVLSFREKRRDELLALRHHLERIYSRVTNSGDQQLSVRSECEALDQAVSNYVKSTKGLGLSMRLASLEASLNLAGPTVSSLVAYHKGLSVTDAALVGLGAAITIKAGAGLLRSKSVETPFRYVSSYHNELFPP